MNRNKVTFAVILLLLVVLGVVALIIGLKIQEGQQPISTHGVYPITLPTECLPGKISSAPKCYESNDWSCLNTCPWPQSAYCFYETTGQGQCGCAMPTCHVGIASSCYEDPTCKAKYVCSGSSTDKTVGWTWNGNLNSCTSTDPDHTNWTVCSTKTDEGCVIDHKVNGTCTSCSNGTELEVYCKPPESQQGYKCDTTTKICPMESNCIISQSDPTCYALKLTCDTNALIDCPAQVVQGYKCDTTTRTCPVTSNCTVNTSDPTCYPAKATCDTNASTNCPATITRYKCSSRDPTTCDLSENICSTTNSNDPICNATNYPYITNASCKQNVNCNELPPTGLDDNGLSLVQIILGLFILGSGFILIKKVNYNYFLNRKLKFEEKVLKSLD